LFIRWPISEKQPDEHSPEGRLGPSLQAHIALPGPANELDRREDTSLETADHVRKRFRGVPFKQDVGAERRRASHGLRLRHLSFEECTGGIETVALLDDIEPGFFGCKRHADRLFLSGLPAVIKINLRDDMTGQWLEHSIRHLVAEAGSGRPGRSVLLSKMAEALFIASLRRYMEKLPEGQTGWLAAARDKIVGAAIAAMHRAPGRP
jgi:hypothetical protein